MARKLLRFTNLLAVPAVLLGVWLWLGYGIGRGPGNGWMHAKLTVVLLVLGYHHACGRMLRRFEAGLDRRSHTWYRWFNEVPVLMMVAAVVLLVAWAHVKGKARRSPAAHPSQAGRLPTRQVLVEQQEAAPRHGLVLGGPRESRAG